MHRDYIEAAIRSSLPPLASPTPRPHPCERTNTRVDEAPSHANDASERTKPRRRRLFVRSHRPCPNQQNPKPQHYPRHRHAQTIALRRALAGTPSVNGYARASLNAASKQVLQYSSHGRSTSTLHEHLDGEEFRHQEFRHPSNYRSEQLARTSACEAALRSGTELIGTIIACA
jgi:hypothetical protein